MTKSQRFLFVGLGGLIVFLLFFNLFSNKYGFDQTVDQQTEQTDVSSNGSSSDSDPNPDSGSNSDTDSSTDSGSNSDSGSNTDSDTNSDSESNTNSGTNSESNTESDQTSNPNSDPESNESSEIVWGVDSASYTDENMYQCVRENFGKPTVWGRYLGTNEDVSVGIDTDEVNLLHENDVRILVIYNHVTDATGYDVGVEHAEKAISMAKDLSIPEGVGLFVDIEPSYPVDSDFIQGWYDTVSSSNYHPAIYGVFNDSSELLTAYNAINADAQANTVVWTAHPQEQITTKENAPEFNPQGPGNSKLYGWQYAIEAETCNIDTNLFKSEILDYLW